jgi:hypothetical protein
MTPATIEKKIVQIRRNPWYIYVQLFSRCYEEITCLPKNTIPGNRRSPGIVTECPCFFPYSLMIFCAIV